MEAKIFQKIIEHQKMAAYHAQEATRLIEKAQGGDLSSPARKGGLSDAFKAKLIANGRKLKKQ